MCYWFYADISVVKRSKHNAHNVVFELLECCEKERERERDIEKRQRKFAGYFKTQVTLSFSIFKSTWLLAINVFEFSNVRSASLIHSTTSNSRALIIFITFIPFTTPDFIYLQQGS